MAIEIIAEVYGGILESLWIKGAPAGDYRVRVLDHDRRSVEDVSADKEYQATKRDLETDHYDCLY